VQLGVFAEPFVQPGLPVVEHLVAGLEQDFPEVGGVSPALGVLAVLHQSAHRKSEYVEFIGDDLRLWKV
jgi:hypothetical protein